MLTVAGKITTCSAGGRDRGVREMGPPHKNMLPPRSKRLGLVLRKRSICIGFSSENSYQDGYQYTFSRSQPLGVDRMMAPSSVMTGGTVYQASTSN